MKDIQVGRQAETETNMGSGGWRAGDEAQYPQHLIMDYPMGHGESLDFLLRKGDPVYTPVCQGQSWFMPLASV